MAIIKQAFVGDDIANKIGLTTADQEEYKATQQYSKAAQAKINDYKAKRDGPLRPTGLIKPGEQYIQKDTSTAIAQKNNMGTPTGGTLDLNKTGGPINTITSTTSTIPSPTETKLNTGVVDVKVSDTGRGTEKNLVTGATDALNTKVENTAVQTDNMKNYSAEDTKIANENIALQEKLNKEYIQKENEKKLQIENDIKAKEAALKDQEQRTIDATQIKKDSELEAMKATADKQKFQDEEAVRKAQEELEVSKLRSAWAFNRMGVTGSSAAISTMNKITTEGANVIAGLKLSSAANEADFKYKTADIEYKYTTAINTAIDNYTEKYFQIKDQHTKMIGDYLDNVFLSESEKDKAIQGIKDNLVKTIRENETNLYNFVNTKNTEILNEAKTIQQLQVSSENTYKARANDLITSGAIFNRTKDELYNLAKSAGIPYEELITIQNNSITAEAITKMQSAIGTDYIPTSSELAQINAYASTLMAGGKSREASMVAAVNKVLANNSEYAAVKNKKAAETTLGAAKTTSELNLLGINDFSGLYTGNNGPAFANNNPGNIKDTSFGGSTGGKGGFTKFNSIEDGMNALVEKIKYNQSNGIGGVNNGSRYNGNMSLLDYFKIYAPASDNNNPNSYANTVANNLGISANTKIKDIDANSFAVEIARHENGGVYNEMKKRGLIKDGTFSSSNSGKYTADEITQKGIELGLSQWEVDAMKTWPKDKVDEFITKKSGEKTTGELTPELEAEITKKIPYFSEATPKSKEKIAKLNDNSYFQLLNDLPAVDTLINDTTFNVEDTKNKLKDLIQKLRVGFDDYDIKKILSKYTDDSKSFYVNGNKISFQDKTFGTTLFSSDDTEDLDNLFKN